MWPIRCPANPETVNGYQDEDGCPDEKPVDDTDGDGYKDDVDRCPYDAEDFDNYEDADGCPEPDNDTDGILDVDDACPLEREIYNGVDDEDGCPDEGRVVVESSQIKILEKIYFDFNQATIQTRSFSLLDEIAATIVAHPSLLKIRVEGHTDNVGGDETNRNLSQERALAVMNYLIASGVEANRLDARGFGEDYPIDSNETDEVERITARWMHHHRSRVGMVWDGCSALSCRVKSGPMCRSNYRNQKIRLIGVRCWCWET